MDGSRTGYTHVLAMNVPTNGDRSLDLNHVGLGAEELRRMLEDVNCVLFCQSALTEEMVAQDADIGLLRAKFVLGKELEV
jgi:hypothetical protein